MSGIKHFKPKAHILRLLGEELIKSPVMAIYELVKNSYDADAETVNVNFNNIKDLDNVSIKIKDNGTGLTSEVIENVWLEPGTDHRKPIDENGNRVIYRSPLFDRVPMGEKGVGRFAVHKLGEKITLITRPATIVFDGNGENPKKELLDYEITLKIDWEAFSQSKYLEDIPITWETNKDASKFTFQNDSGTLIQVECLKENWTRGMARSLKRNIVSMLSPKNNANIFKIELDFENEWLEDFPDANKVLDVAPYKYTALLDSDYNLTVDYECSLALNESFGKREIKNQTQNIKGSFRKYYRAAIKDENLTEEEIEATLELMENDQNIFGSILLEIYSFDLDPETLRNYTYDSKTLKNVLKLHSGIKVFKDDMRVFNYGEPGNDWLELDIRRVQNKQWFSNNQNIGFVYLDSSASQVLIEKTNREGFIENTTYQAFYYSMIAILNDFRIERDKDREKWLSFINPAKNKISYDDQVSLFNELIDSTNFSENEQKTVLKNEVAKLQKDFDDKKETLLIPAGVGMTASVALHEMEKVVPHLKEIIYTQPFHKLSAKEKIEELEDYLKGILSVLRKGGNKPINLVESINKSISNYNSKFRRRKITVQTEFDESIETIKCDKRYFITMLMNLLDNSIYWLDTLYQEKKSIYIKTLNYNNLTTVIIADNGPGFKDDITDLVRPFFTRKDDGIGIGLYLIDTLMMKYGKLEIIDSEEEFLSLSIPPTYRGAAVKLIFSKGQ
ncbi:sensor histidine kinase [Lentisphaera profundi]|uniref:histidine kinase n=1 Tax=Lentisphaera profundi TaxID=1658616 RepID=A0ABY7VW90_9BACT|nr:sensor histidine kinase [Lentisphaera profundi]WDE97538.1 sensor histidine kinase [Lentisphaera profundi]